MQQTQTPAASVTKDEYLKELDTLFSSALNLLKIQTSSIASNSSQEDTSSCSPNVEADGHKNYSNSSGVSLKSSKSASSSSSTSSSLSSSTSHTSVNSKLKFNHDFSETVSLPASTTLAKSRKSKSFHSVAVGGGGGGGGVKVLHKASSSSPFKQNKLTATTNKVAKPLSQNVKLKMAASARSNKPTKSIKSPSFSAEKSASPSLNNQRSKQISNCENAPKSSSAVNEKRAPTALSLQSIKAPTTTTAKMSVLKDKLNYLNQTASSSLKNKASKNESRRGSTSSTDSTTTTSHSTTTSVLSKSTTSKTTSSKMSKSKADDTDLDVSLSNYSKLNVPENEEEKNTNSKTSEKSTAKKRATQIEASLVSQKKSKNSTLLKLGKKPSSLDTIIQRKKLNIINSTNQNSQSLMSLLNTLNNNNTSSHQAANISNLLADLFLINLLQVNTQNLAGMFSDFIKFTKKRQQNNLFTTIPINDQKRTKKSKKPTECVASMNYSSLSSSMSSLHYLENCDQFENEYNYNYNYDSDAQSIGIKSTSTKIDKLTLELAADYAIIEDNKKPAPSAKQQQTAKNTPATTNRLEIPNIEDPMQFIDNLYNQLVANHKNASDTKANASSDSYNEDILSMNTFNVNNDFSFIDLYSNATNESNSMSINTTMAKDAGGVLSVRNKNLIDWNYDDNITNLNTNLNNEDEENEEEDDNFFKNSLTAAESLHDEAGQTTIISNEKDSVCNCDNCCMNKESALNQNSNDPKAKRPSWLMLKLLNSCSDLKEERNLEIRPNNISSRDHLIMKPRTNMSRFLSLGDFKTVPCLNASSNASTSIRSSTSTTYLPIKKSHTFPVVEKKATAVLTVCTCDQHKQVSLPSQQKGSYVQVVFKSFIRSLKYFLSTKNILILPVIVVLLNMRLKRHSQFSISSGSAVSLSNVMLTSSLTTAATASAARATTASLNSLISYYNQS